MKTHKTIILFFSLLFTGLTGNSQPAGTLDVTFNGTGKVVYNFNQTDVYNDVLVQPDGKIIATGTFYTPSYAGGIEVTRYNTDGTFDTGFASAGHFNYMINNETGSNKCLRYDDGKILIAGYTTNYTNWWMLFVRLKADGTLDSTFGIDGIAQVDPGSPECIAYDAEILNDGKIIASGYRLNASSFYEPVVFRLLENGLLDTSFGDNGFATVPVTEVDNEFAAVSIQSDGKILAAGHISNGTSWFSILIARFNPEGTIDESYGDNGIVNLNLNNVDDEIFDMKLTADDEAILCGFTVLQSNITYHLLLMKMDNSGDPVTSFGNNGYVIAGSNTYAFGDDVEVQSDGRILIAGCNGATPPDDNDWALWRFNSDGTTDNTFGTNGMVMTDFFGRAEEALGMDLFENTIIVAGKTRNNANRLDFAVARYLNDIGVGITEKDMTGTFVNPNPVGRNQDPEIHWEQKTGNDVRIELLDTGGKLLKNYTINNVPGGGQSYRISLSELPAGTYLIRISGTGSETESMKVIRR